MSCLDKTFCASPNCKNECGRKMTDKERDALDRLPLQERVISQAYFCSEQANLIGER